MSERLKSSTSENSDWLDQWNKIADDERVDKFKENAAQELMERELNSELTKVDDLFNAVRAHEKGLRGHEPPLILIMANKAILHFLYLRGIH